MKHDIILRFVLRQQFPYLVENYYFCITKTLNVFFYEYK